MYMYMYGIPMLHHTSNAYRLKSLTIVALVGEHDFTMDALLGSHLTDIGCCYHSNQKYTQSYPSPQPFNQCAELCMVKHWYTIVTIPSTL
jgi:hypothetical protein